VLAADVLPPIEEEEEGEQGTSGGAARLTLPARLRAKHASIAVPGDKAVIKLLSSPGHFDERAEEKIVGNLGLEDPAGYRISYKLTSEGHGRSESRVLAVALPEDRAVAAVSLLPSGLPAPYSLEVSGLASMTAFLHGPGATHSDEAVGAIDLGTDASTLALLNGGTLVLLRRFDFGLNMILAKVRQTLGVDRETALGILSDGSVDVSQSASEVMGPLIKQLIVSRDFLERRENCRVSRIYACGSMVLPNASLDEMRAALGVEIETWNPFDGLSMASEALPENLAGQEWKFSAAVGACLGTFEET
jgi:Tfp pilus assembly PilM family ATPase